MARLIMTTITIAAGNSVWMTGAAQAAQAAPEKVRAPRCEDSTGDIASSSSKSGRKWYTCLDKHSLSTASKGANQIVLSWLYNLVFPLLTQDRILPWL